MTLKQKLKSFFRAREGSEEAVELLRMFILPFAKKMKRAGVDDVISAFFGLEDRQFVYAKAIRDFKMPGKYFVAGNRPIYGLGPRVVLKDKSMLIAVDRITGTARIEIVLEGASQQFMLEKFEFITIKDWIKLIE